MKNLSKIDIASITKKLNELIHKAKGEVEEMAVQFSLGKAETTDQFDKMKKEFHEKLQSWKQFYPEMEATGKEGVEKFKAKMEDLQLQLRLGKADAKDLFEEQKKKIMHSISQLESEIKSNPTWNKYRKDL